MAGIIDIGSNSVRLLLGGKKTTVITRLSEGLQDTGRLSENAINRTLETVYGFIRQTRGAGEKVHAFGTEPLRAASNASVVLDAAKAAGLDIKVISGAEEAELAFFGAANGGGGVVDIGGASTEIVCGNKNIIYQKSLPLGAVRLSDQGKGSVPKIEEYISDLIGGYGQVPLCGKLYGVGGTLTSLAAVCLGLEVYDSQKVHHTHLTADKLDGIIKELAPLDRTGIMARYKTLSPLRAEIIFAGTILARRLLDYLGQNEIIVSESDNLEGYQIKYLNEEPQD